MQLSEPARTQADLNFSLFGIPVRVNPMFWLIAAMLGMGATRGEPLQMFLWVLVVFVSVLVHELGHAFTALAHGWPPSITLHGFGGLASYSPTHYTPRSRILITAAGPAAGFALAALVVLVSWALGYEFEFFLGPPLGLDWNFRAPATGLGASSGAQLFVHFMLFANIAWGIFNLLPIQPLDGGTLTLEFMGLLDRANAIRRSLILSMVTAAGLALYVGVKFRQPFLALFLGYLAFTSYQGLQNLYGRGGGFDGDRG